MLQEQGSYSCHQHNPTAYYLAHRLKQQQQEKKTLTKDPTQLLSRGTTTAFDMEMGLLNRSNVYS